jgi:putative ribosome biogenesis GTPase RsgA
MDIQDIAPSSSINAKIILVDKQDSLAMEIKDGIKDNLDDTIGLPTLSNSKSTMASYSAIFENLSKENHIQTTQSGLSKSGEYKCNTTRIYQCSST